MVKLMYGNKKTFYETFERSKKNKRDDSGKIE